MSNLISLPVETLPSKGYHYKFKAINIPKMVFSEILEYQSEMEGCPSEAAEFITMLKTLVLPLQNGGDVLLYDAIPVIAVRIYSSASDTLTDKIRIKYECPVHKKKETLEIHLCNFVFHDMDPMLKKIKSVKLGGKSFDFVLPTVRDFIQITESFRLKVPVKNALKYFYMLSMFKDSYDERGKNEILKAINNATSKDIVTLNTLYQMLTGAFDGFKANCISGTEPVTVRLNSLSPVTDIFQNILESERLDEAAFDFRKDDKA